MRTEIYGLDNSAKTEIPYTVSSFRYQIRQIQASDTSEAIPPVVMPITLEQLNYHYERIPEDPQCNQEILVKSDLYGFPLQRVTINYPRREQNTIGVNPYPSTLPASSWNSSYDSQQAQLRINESLMTYHHLGQGEDWRLGLPHEQRTNVLQPAHSGLISIEDLIEVGGILDSSATRIYAGQQETFYTGPNSESTISVPTTLGLVAYREIAEFDDAALAAFNGQLTQSELNTKLAEAGYVKSASLLPFTTEK